MSQNLHNEPQQTTLTCLQLQPQPQRIKRTCCQSFISLILLSTQIIIITLISLYLVPRFYNSPTNYYVYKELFTTTMSLVSGDMTQIPEECTRFLIMNEAIADRLNSENRMVNIILSVLILSLSLFFNFLSFIYSFKSKLQSLRVCIWIAEYANSQVILLSSPLFIINYMQYCISTMAYGYVLLLLSSLRYFTLLTTLSFGIVLLHRQKIVNFQSFYYLCWTILILFLIFIALPFWLLTIFTPPYCFSPLFLFKFAISTMLYIQIQNGDLEKSKSLQSERDIENELKLKEEKQYFQNIEFNMLESQYVVPNNSER